ncbi:MAG: hypothetical protein CMN28_14785 [Salinisphaeraceae bacterium]|nr:hypothetical protein [Salinisphaeraceae bacterium]
MYRSIALTLGLSIASGAAFAGQHKDNAKASAGMEIGVDTGMSIDQQFKKLDADGNGMISMQEASANESAKRAFESLDNGDGELTLKEYRSGLKARASGKGNMNAGESAEDGSLDGEMATVGAGTDTEIDTGKGMNPSGMKKKGEKVAAGIGAEGSASAGKEAGKSLSKPMKTRFRGLDNNDDGMITRSEAKADPIIIGVFDAHDGNDDGKLDAQEFVAAAKAGVKAKTSAGGS